MSLSDDRPTRVVKSMATVTWYNAAASRGVPVYASVFAGTHCA